MLPPGPLQHLHQVQVVQPEVVCHIDLETGDPFCPGNLRHIVQRFVVHMLQHAVEAVVHRGIPVRQPVVFLHLCQGLQPFGPKAIWSTIVVVPPQAAAAVPV